MPVEMIDLTLIRADGGTQARAGIDAGTVDEYEAALEDTATWSPDRLPPLEAVLDANDDCWLWDGFHRLDAYRRMGLTAVPVNVVEGTLDDARWLACAANQTHGLRMSAADKRAAVKLALEMRPEMSDRAIATHCAVGPHLVADVRAQLCARTVDGPRKGLDGKTRKLPAPRSAPSSEGTAADPEDVARLKAAFAGVGESPKATEADNDEFKARDAAGAVDDWGIPIQAHAVEAFASRPLFDEILRILKEAQGKVTALVESAGGKMLPAQWERGGGKAGGRFVISHIDNAISEIRRCRPCVTDCPYAFNAHQPHGDKCPLCRNLRWIGNPKVHQVPPACVAAMKAHYGITEAATGGEGDAA